MENHFRQLISNFIAKNPDKVVVNEVEANVSVLMVFQYNLLVQ